MTQAASTRTKALVLMHGIFQRARKVWSLPANPVADVEKPPLSRSGDLQVFSPEEVWALVRAAASDVDGAMFLTGAFTGLRMGELLALRWRDVDFAGSSLARARELLRGVSQPRCPARYAPSRWHPTWLRLSRRSATERIGLWMGYADIQTTMRYLHYAPHADDAHLVAVAFALPAQDGSRSDWSDEPATK